MDAKGKKDASGCLVIVGLIGGFLLVKNVIWPWVVDNKESVGSWAVVVLAVTASDFFLLGIFFVSNASFISMERGLKRKTESLKSQRKS